MLRHWFKKRAAKREMAEAQAEFNVTAQAIVEANRAARASGRMISPDLLLAAEKNSVALQNLQRAKHNLEQVTGGPDAVELTDVVRHKLDQLFSSEDRAGAIRLLEKECGRGLPFHERATPQDLERVRLAVLKLSRGNLSELLRQVQVAKTDWRDVLLAAEQPEALGVGLVHYSELTVNERREIDTRDREQYDLWLHCTPQ